MIAASVTSAGLALAAGVALDRVVLAPPPSPTPVAAVAPRPSRTAAAPDTARPAPSRTARRDLGENAPPLKRLRPSASAAPSRAARPDGVTSRPAAPDARSVEALAITLTNRERAKAGCRALRPDPHLRTAARAHSAEMAAKNYFDHASRNGDSPWDRMRKAGYGAPGAENIARGYATAEAVVRGWMGSPGHRANIVNCGLRAIGVGFASGPGGPWWTQDFGWS
ncbi:Cysteine-rich secretory protein family protein [Actinomadura rubteroloni]|uniref:Cysteine-rich secretory protein family protein n=1 Tax=Actinomadura rubteroloni TaxID=1926885 RepID=A0A2P4UJX6_9ACTN|nr:CAP domain-containing protein [Actinomadura rubteroloni]POM25354.1 Cysteine-rich secretory protein family protein [Actinomadura rubteroloni]